MDHISREQPSSCMLLESYLGFVYIHVCVTYISTRTGGTRSLILQEEKGSAVVSILLQPLCVSFSNNFDYQLPSFIASVRVRERSEYGTCNCCGCDV